MSNGPYFETWSHENLAKFANEAYLKLQKQEQELHELRLREKNPWPFPKSNSYPNDMPEALF